MQEELNLPFDEAIAYFRGKVPVPTESWNQFEAEEHDFAFTIAGLTKAELLDDARWLVDRSISQGMSFEEFQKQFQRLIGRKGWTPDPLPAGPPDWRMRIIFETNLRRAYSAGRYKKMEDPQLIERRPYRMWQHGDSPNPRKKHLALDGKVFPATSNFWKIATPICAYGCKCKVFTLSKSDVERMGKTIDTPPDPNTIAEPGFRRAPGSNPARERKQVLKRGISKLSPTLEKQVKKELKAKGIL